MRKRLRKALIVGVLAVAAVATAGPATAALADTSSDSGGSPIPRIPSPCELFGNIVICGG